MFDIKVLTVVMGGTYLNRGGDTVKIKATVNRHDRYFEDGYRFVDSEGRMYTNKGKWSTDPRPTNYDLIKLVK